MKVLYGTRKGQPDYMEELLLSDATDKQIETVKPLAAAEGFDRFRVAVYSDIPERPDFSKIFN